MSGKFSIREDVNRLMKKAGWENPDSVSEEIRFEEAMRILLKVPMVGPEGYKHVKQPESSNEKD